LRYRNCPSAVQHLHSVENVTYKFGEWARYREEARLHQLWFAIQEFVLQHADRWLPTEYFRFDDDDDTLSVPRSRPHSRLIRTSGMKDFVWQLGYGFKGTGQNRKPFCRFRSGEQTKHSLFPDSLMDWSACRLSITIDGKEYGKNLQLAYYGQDEFNVTIADALKQLLASMEVERRKLLAMPPLPEGYETGVLERFYCSLPEGERKEVWRVYEGVGVETDKRTSVALMLENKKTLAEAVSNAEAAVVDATAGAARGAAAATEIDAFLSGDAAEPAAEPAVEPAAEPAEPSAEATTSKKRPRDPVVEEAARQQQSLAREVGGISVGDVLNFIGKDEVIDRERPWKKRGE